MQIFTDRMELPPGFITADSLGRRQYTLEFKLAVIKDVKNGGLTVAAAARKHDINANMLSKWMRFYEEGTLRASNVAVARMAPVEIIPDPTPMTAIAMGAMTPSAPLATNAANTASNMIMKLPNGTVLKVRSDIDRTALKSALQMLRDI